MAILQDPVMQSILQQAKGDPAALQDHMKNPAIAGKVQKLIAAGMFFIPSHSQLWRSVLIVDCRCHSHGTISARARESSGSVPNVEG